MNKLIKLRICPRTTERYRPYLSLFPDFGELMNLANTFAGRNGIFSLDWKCSTWSKVNRDIMKVLYRAILDGVPGSEKVSYSRTLGCSCGCSPGFKVEGTGLNNKNGYGYIYIDLLTASVFEKKLDSYYQNMFDNEKKGRVV